MGDYLNREELDYQSILECYVSSLKTEYIVWERNRGGMSHRDSALFPHNITYPGWCIGQCPSLRSNCPVMLTSSLLNSSLVFTSHDTLNFGQTKIRNSICLIYKPSLNSHGSLFFSDVLTYKYCQNGHYCQVIQGTLTLTQSQSLNFLLILFFTTPHHKSYAPRN